MAIHIKTQKNYYLTEATISLPASLDDVDYLMKAVKSTGRIVSTYNQGGMMMITVEQKTRIPESIDQQIRDIIGISTKNV